MFEEPGACDGRGEIRLLTNAERLLQGPAPFKQENVSLPPASYIISLRGRRGRDPSLEGIQNGSGWGEEEGQSEWKSRM